MSEKSYINNLVEKYLIFKRGLGFKMKGVETELHSFVVFTENSGYDGYITKEVALRWISRETESSKTKGRRLETLRPFMQYAHTVDVNNEEFLSQIFPNVRQRPDPHIYSEEETVSLIQRCNCLASSDGLRIQSMKLVLGILWSTGMRPNEVASLKLGDIDRINETIMIHDTKMHKERIIPVHSSVIKKIQEYIQFLNTKGLFLKESDRLLYTTGKKPFTLTKIRYAFKLIRKDINHEDSDYPNIRLYDFRHTFACRVIFQWLSKNENINSKLYILSVYLGHEKPNETYWYLSSTASIMKLVSDLYEEKVGDLK